MSDLAQLLRSDRFRQHEPGLDRAWWGQQDPAFAAAEIGIFGHCKAERSAKVANGLVVVADQQCDISNALTRLGLQRFLCRNCVKTVTSRFVSMPPIRLPRRFSASC